MSQHPSQQTPNQKIDNLLPEAPELYGTTDHSASTQEHRAQAPQCVRCFVITVSDTRTRETDKGGALIEELLAGAGHECVERRLVPDVVEDIRTAVRDAENGLHNPDAIIVTGGSGIGPRDVTPEAIRPLLTKELPGFGEMFRVLSWSEIGPATMLSRAFAGVRGRTLLFVLPGSPNAVRLAMEKLIVPELGHVVREARPEEVTR
jgi:molybdenum cofactor biosynthesis protein B